MSCFLCCVLAEKFEEYSGTEDGSSPGGGYITSPGFPVGYATNHEVYTYLIRNTDPQGRVRLSFQDWSLSPNSKIAVSISCSRVSVCFHNHIFPRDVVGTLYESQEGYFLLFRSNKDTSPIKK